MDIAQEEATERFARQRGLVDTEKLAATKVLMVGAGSVGSFTALALAKMGVGGITIYDHDSIETHNIPNQFYPEMLIGRNKAEALADVVMSFSGLAIVGVPTKWEGKTAFDGCGIIISSVDNMDARKALWEAHKGKEVLFIDPRMGAQVMLIYTIRAWVEEDQKLYERSLHPQSEAVPEPCTARTIIYTVLLVAGFVAAQVKKHITGEAYHREVIYDAKLGILVQTK